MIGHGGDILLVRPACLIATVLGRLVRDLAADCRQFQAASGRAPTRSWCAPPARPSRGRSATSRNSSIDRSLRDGYFFAEVNVLDRVQQFDAFFHRALERFASGDQAHAARAFVDDGGEDGVFEITGSL